MQKGDLPTSFTKLNENCGLPDLFTDYQIRHLGNPSGLPGILLKIDPWWVSGKIGRYSTQQASALNGMVREGVHAGELDIIVS